MKLISVLTEYQAWNLNRPFYYLYKGKRKIPLYGRVKIDFNHRSSVGFIVGVEEKQDNIDEIIDTSSIAYKEIMDEDIIDEDALLSDELLELAKQVSEYYVSPLMTVLQAMLPLSLSPKRTALKGPKIKYDYFLVTDKAEDETLTAKQKEIYRLVALHQPVLKKEAGSPSIVKKLLDNGYFKLKKREHYRLRVMDESFDYEKKVLTPKQQEAMEAVLNAPQNVFLIEGVTGSGKTEIYLHLIEHYLKEDAGIIYLVPEISLTPRLVSLLKNRFGDQVAILHSGLTPSERYDEYRKMRDGKAKVAIGARSAVFSPIKNLKLIIIDEEHVESYKQDVPPFYHAREVAILRANITGAKVVLGSATPSFETRARALKGKYGYYLLKERINGNIKIDYQIIDLKTPHIFGNLSDKLSLPLIEKINEKLSKGEQVLLLMNRRGYWTGVTCANCNHMMTCPDCGSVLTYHRSDNLLKCHHCGHVEEFPKVCPVCGARNFRRVGFGIERVEEDLHTLFPDKKIARLDSDISRLSFETSKLLRDFYERKYDILLGTQIIAKGHDFPYVTLSAVVLADIGLTLPTFRASERSFELISQMVGRSGRSSLKGEALIQTFNPDHYAITLGAKQDYDTFYKREMRERYLNQNPPYFFLYLLIVKGKENEETMNEAISIRDYLRKELPNDKVIGPFTPYYSMMDGKFRKQIIIKIKNQDETRSVLRNLLQTYKSGGRISLQVNADPMDY